MLAGDSFVKQHETSSEVVHRAAGIRMFSGSHSPVRHQNVTPALFVPPFPNCILFDTAVGRVTQADQEPAANLCYGYSPSEELSGGRSQQGCVWQQSSLPLLSRLAATLVTNRKLRLSFQIQTLLRKQFSANWAHKVLKIETVEIISMTSTPIIKRNQAFLREENSKLIQILSWGGREGECCWQLGREPVCCSLPDFHGCTEHSISLYHLVNLWYHQLLPGKPRNYRFGSWQLDIKRKYLALLGVKKESWNKFQNNFELEQNWDRSVIPNQTIYLLKW